MNVAIIGSGIAGLCAAHYLCQHKQLTIDVFEKASVFGGRANVTGSGDHCPRLFLSDYRYFFGILAAVPAEQGSTLFQQLRQPRRMFLTESSGWVEISHMYSMLSHEVSLLERARIVWAKRRSPLIAEQPRAINENRYGSRTNFSYRTLVRTAWNMLRSRTAYSFDGPSDECLIDPWVRSLRQQGIRLHAGSRVEGLRQDREKVALDVDGEERIFDAVIVAAFCSDTARLLDSSGIPHVLQDLQHTHCKCFTIDLNPAEAVLQSDVPVMYCCDGINIIVHPSGSRCVALCTRSKSTEHDFVISRITDYLSLEHPIGDVRVRDNQLPEEAVYCADYVDPRTILVDPIPGVFFSGSYVSNSYPIDSGEGAVRSGINALRRVESFLALPHVPAVTADEPERQITRV